MFRWQAWSKLWDTPGETRVWVVFSNVLSCALTCDADSLGRVCFPHPHFVVGPWLLVVTSHSFVPADKLNLGSFLQHVLQSNLLAHGLLMQCSGHMATEQLAM